MLWRARSGRPGRRGTEVSIKLTTMAGGIALSLLAVPAAQAVPLYSVTDLGDLGGGVSIANGINDSGQVVGYSHTGAGNHAFLWSNATGMQDLGEFPGGLDDSQAFDINNAGQVVGTSYGAMGFRAFRWSSGSGMQEIGSVPGAFSIFGMGINDSGESVGAGAGYAFLHSDLDGSRDIGDLPGGANSSGAADINNTGQVVGQSSSATGTHAFLWSEADGMQDLGVLPGGSFSNATGINDAGEVVGSSHGAGTHAFLWVDGLGMQDLGNLPGGLNNSSANDINNSGNVVGSSYSSTGIHAFLWENGAGMLDLNTLLDSSGTGWLLRNAAAINDLGQIVGLGVTPQGARHAFLLTPVVQQVTGVPEPSTLLLIGSGCVLLALGRRRFNRSALTQRRALPITR